MNFFQTLVAAAVFSLTTVFATGTQFHAIASEQLFGWTWLPQSGPLLLALQLGTGLGLFVHFRHDILSHLSSLLQIAIYRRKPTSIDEKVPLFLFISLGLFFLARHYLAPLLEPFYASMPSLTSVTAAVVGASFVAITFLWIFSDSRSRRTKSMADWNLFDAFILGIGQAFSIIPGIDFIASSVIFSQFRNYQREASYKYAGLCATWSLLLNAGFHSSDWRPPAASTAAATDITLSQFWTITGISLVLAAFGAGALIKTLERGTFRTLFSYRIFILFFAPLVVWLKIRWLG